MFNNSIPELKFDEINIDEYQCENTNDIRIKVLNNRGIYEIHLGPGKIKGNTYSKYIDKIKELFKDINVRIIENSEYFEEAKLTETGEMGQHDIEPGGEDYEWSESMKNEIIKLGKLTKGRVKFIEMRPFDKYQGPYARTLVNGKNESIWSVSNKDSENLLFIEGLRFTGTVEELAMALNGNRNMIKQVLKNTKEME